MTGRFIKVQIGLNFQKDIIQTLHNFFTTNLKPWNPLCLTQFAYKNEVEMANPKLHLRYTMECT